MARVDEFTSLSGSVTCGAECQVEQRASVIAGSESIALAIDGLFTPLDSILDKLQGNATLCTHWNEC